MYGWYVLSDVPAGNYELAFVSGKSIDYLHLDITDNMADTVYIKIFILDIRPERSLQTTDLINSRMVYPIPLNPPVKRGLLQRGGYQS